MDKKLGQSIEAKTGGIGIGTIVGLIQMLGLPVATGGYIIGAIIVATILAEALEKRKPEAIEKGKQDGSE